MAGFSTLCIDHYRTSHAVSKFDGFGGALKESDGVIVTRPAQITGRRCSDRIPIPIELAKILRD
jgi:hypothetical protein